MDEYLGPGLLVGLPPEMESLSVMAGKACEGAATSREELHAGLTNWTFENEFTWVDAEMLLSVRHGD